MSGFKKSQPGLAFAGEKISPDEIDRNEIYTVVMPGTSDTFWASAGTAGTNAAVAMVVVNRYPDYPRNIRFAIAGSHAAMGGTLSVNGYDQFGSTITENIGFAGSTNGGTVVGTKVFAQITTGTLNYGSATGNGTPAIGFVTGTNALFGLPYKLSGTSDVVFMSHVAGTGAVTVNGGTVGGFVNTAMSAVRPAAAVTGTEVINVWIRPTFDPHGKIVRVSNLTQAS